MSDKPFQPNPLFVPVGGSTDSEVHRLLKKDMDDGVAEMNRIIDASMFHYSAERALFEAYQKPPSWWRRRIWPISSYVWTLWRALRGDELDTPQDDDY
jgi:hypothetical protein